MHGIHRIGHAGHTRHTRPTRRTRRDGRPGRTRRIGTLVVRLLVGATLATGVSAWSMVASAAAEPGDRSTESPDGPEWVKEYLTEAEALALAFPDADSTWTERWVPTDEERTTLERRLGWRLHDDAFEIHRGAWGGKPRGYAVITEEVGLYKPITFLVTATDDLEVEQVRIMVYRESRGDEVKRMRFLSQYEGKSVGSPIRIDRDIVAITGATLSVRALNAGVRKVLAVLEARFGEGSAP